MQLGVKKVPTLSYLDGNNSLEIEWAVIEANRQRVKTPEQKAREFTELKRIEAALAKERQGTRTDIGANLPECSRAREKAAKVVGLGARTAEKLEKVVEAAGQGNAEARAVLDEVNQKNKSVDAAYRVVNESSEERAARKEEKRDRNRQRYEHANKIIEAGVAALKQAGEFSEDTQAALDWLRKVITTPPPPKVIVTAPDTPEPVVAAPEVSTATQDRWTEEAISRLQDIRGLSRPEAIRTIRAADAKYDKEYEAFESAIQPYHDAVAAARREIESLKDAPKKELREATKKKAAAEKALDKGVKRLRPKDPFADLWKPHYDEEARKATTSMATTETVATKRAIRGRKRNEL